MEEVKLQIMQFTNHDNSEAYTLLKFMTSAMKLSSSLCIALRDETTLLNNIVKY